MKKLWQRKNYYKHGRFVVDTTSVISYFESVFKQPPKISQPSLNIIENAFCDTTTKLIIPSIVFIEIYKKWFTNNEQANKIRYEVYYPLKERENIFIAPLDQEVLLNFIKITDIKSKHNFDNHDKQILATAMMYNCPLITSDGRITKHNKTFKLIPQVLT